MQHGIFFVSKNKGFTLIELLAVIVILAIIALIATPIIVGLIDDARKEAFKDSAYGIVKSGELLYSKDLLNGINEEVTFTYTGGVESSSVSGKQLNYNGTKPKSGTVILENDILAYLVWIPRYKYKLFNVEAASIPVQTIEIEFESKDISKSNGSTNGAWLTHPAFTFGSEELSGFWVGKFETTGTETTPTVKPGLVPLASQIISVQFATSQKFNNTTTYGLTSTNDSHMMKNIEWGAVTYLTGSIYGKNTEVWVNPSSNYITGCAGTSASVGNSSGCAHQYTTSNGQQASTTGNTYGIYGMSGGILERVMSSIYGDSSNTSLMVSNSGFIQATIDSPAMLKYIDKYVYGETSTDQAAYNRRILGDATGETRGWYGDSTYMVSYDEFFGYYGYPWVGRGGYYNSQVGAGVFNFGTNDGDAYPYDGFRLVLK